MIENEFTTPEAIAKMLGVKTVTIYRYMKRKINPLPHYKLAERNFAIKKRDFDEWMESRFVK